MSQNNNQRSKRPKPNLPPINKNIKFNSFTLIDENGTNLGVVSKDQALAMGDSKGLDVVVISNNSDTVIAKLMDYGKHVYEQKRKKRDNKKKQTVVKVKEINFKAGVGDHDIEWRAKKSLEWLDDGFHVKFTIRAFSRMITREELIKEVHDKFYAIIKDHAEIQKPYTKVSRNMYEAVFIPAKNNKKKSESNPETTTE
ncbi:translation initiation factor IF-3 [Mycoplasma bradburyae]|uniref:Translation initiation factor IF-3 n=1 Tax=Mycoplasma bradburyae TaxID=2963128 RepID=A0AAW6HQV8_9MOLU|nr:translation initiation factor IF-3 [Mycoplasma bradburyae]MDC4163683.1 translation initiation factor IF-3 [Mycoplasma bradburyae]MDC4182292.1 translation initiation factor IF-3 [Mycoplasma bradburyae]MDC4182787.1 translation initiation factor IF-3 [Mycoplasma bradburyae]MDC4183458.1 translation initiation factor IF-3 [Mycoplasma bradburyae]MDC4184466.1 translation initiation factor IF-3 [Mycoplasma bradburyae]